MKICSQMVLALAAGTVLGAGVSGVVLAQTMTKDKVEKIVADYIATHGDALLDSMAHAAAAQQANKANAMITADTPVMGPADAPVTIVEFSDFQCPYCDAVQQTLATIRSDSKYKGKIRWVFKNMPLEFHPQAQPSALAGIAAHKQGKFWEFSKILWANQQNLGKPGFLEGAAKQVGMDVDRFNTDRASEAAKTVLSKDMADAEGVEVRGTPFFLIDGQPISGALPLDTFEKVIDAELAKAKS